MPKTFIISDTHFGHNNIIRFCKRPFIDSDVMDEALIDNWNRVVSKEDTVYVLGDFCYKSRYSLEYYCTQLNGTKHLIIGNHDNFQRTEYERFFASQQHIAQVLYKKQQIVMCHYPILTWNGRAHGFMHCYGHVHGAVLPIMDRQLAYNVSPEVNNYTPIDLDHVVEVLTKRKELGLWKDALTQITEESEAVV